MQLTVCAETVFSEETISGRIEAIGRHGIKHFELWDVDAHEREAVNQPIRSSGYHLSLFCGNRKHSLINPDERLCFLAELQASLKTANELNCPLLTILTDAVDAQGIPIPAGRDLSEVEKLTSLYEGLSQAIHLAEQANVSLVVEALNTKVDHPGYYLSHTHEALEMVRVLDNPRLKMLFDIYHVQIMEGDLIRTMESNLSAIGHIHVADVPGRHEPGTGEINFQSVARMLSANGYDGCVGLECFPASDSDKALDAFTSIFG